MKIDHIRCSVISHPLPAPLRPSWVPGRTFERNVCTLVEVAADGGITGTGELPHGDPIGLQTVAHLVAPYILGKDPFAVESLSPILRYCEFGREVEYTLEPGRATMAHVGLYQGKLRFLTIAVETLARRVTLRRAAGLARTVRTLASDVVRRLLAEGWEHHPCLVYGDVTDKFAAIARLAGLVHTAL